MALRLVTSAASVGPATVQGQGYYGIRLGPLSQLHHGVSGEIYAVDARTIFIKDFNYDGEGPGEWMEGGFGGRMVD